MGAALKLLIHGPAHLYVLLFGLLSAVLQVFMRYARYVSVLNWLASRCSLMSPAPSWWTSPGLGGLGHLWPPISLKADYAMAIVAVFGTTISPYLFFWQAESEVEDQKERDGAAPLIRAPQQAKSEFARMRLDTYIGMAASNIVALSIVITTAATLTPRASPTSSRRRRRPKPCVRSPAR